MIKDLRDARLVDAVPRVVAGQDWVRALSEAVGVLHERTLRYMGYIATAIVGVVIGYLFKRIGM